MLCSLFLCHAGDHAAKIRRLGLGRFLDRGLQVFGQLFHVLRSGERFRVPARRKGLVSIALQPRPNDQRERAWRRAPECVRV